MVVIRLSRHGAKKRPFYKIMVADRCKPRDGHFIENIGYFNPVAADDEVRLNLNMERVQYWLAQGAKPSERVAHFIKKYREIKEAGVSTKEEVVSAPISVAPDVVAADTSATSGSKKTESEETATGSEKTGSEETATGSEKTGSEETATPVADKVEDEQASS